MAKQVGRKRGPQTTESLLKKLSGESGKKAKYFTHDEKKQLLEVNEQFMEFRREFSKDTIAQIELDADLSKKKQLERLVNLRINIASALTSAQLDFIKNYLQDHDSKGAAQRAGLSYTYGQGGGILTIPAVRDYMLVTHKINELTSGITQDFVIGEFLKLARVNIKSLYDEVGNLKEAHELDDVTAAAVSEIKVKTWKEGTKVVTETTYKLHSKLVALDALAKHVGLYEKDNRQKAPIVAQQFVLPDNGRNRELIDNSGIPIIDENKTQ